VRALHELDCIELVRTAQRRGAIEHYYRAIARPFFSDSDWKRLPRSGRQAVTDVILQMVWDDASEAMKRDTFESRSDRHLSRTPLVLDDQGWDELSALLRKIHSQAEGIAAKSGKRLAKSDGEGIPTRLVMMHFEAPR